MRGFEINVKGNLNLAQGLLKNGVENPILVHVSAAGIHIPPFQKGMGAYVSSKYVLPISEIFYIVHFKEIQTLELTKRNRLD